MLYHTCTVTRTRLTNCVAISYIKKHFPLMVNKQNSEVAFTTHDPYGINRLLVVAVGREEIIHCYVQYVNRKLAYYFGTFCLCHT